MILTLSLALLHIAEATPAHSTILSTRSPEPRQQISYTPTQTVYGLVPYWTTSPAALDFNGLTHVAYFGVELKDLMHRSLTKVDGTTRASTLVSRAHAEGIKVHLCLISFSDAVNNVVLQSVLTCETKPSKISRPSSMPMGQTASTITMKVWMPQEETTSMTLFKNYL